MTERDELTLSEIQQGSFQVLLKIKEICEKEGIQFFLLYGTLIGAVRHGGFIPWDDDIDVGMTRENYEKFIKYCAGNKDAIKPFEIIHFSTNKKYIYPIARFSDTRYSIDYSIAKDYGLGLFVDIYPFDYVSLSDRALWGKIIHTRKWINRSGFRKFVKAKTPLRSFLKVFSFTLSRLVNTNRLCRKIDKMAQKYNKEKTGHMADILWEMKFRPYPATWFEEFVLCNFNGVEFPIQSHYDEILKNTYGDYMKLPPVEERVAHHEYSAYKKTFANDKKGA